MKKIVSKTLILCILLTTIGQAQAAGSEIPLDLQDEVIKVEIIELEETAIEVNEDILIINETVEESVGVENIEEIEYQDLVEQQEEIIVEELYIEEKVVEESEVCKGAVEIEEIIDIIADNELISEPSEEVIEEPIGVNETTIEQIILSETTTGTSINAETSQQVSTVEPLLPVSVEIQLPSKLVCRDGKNYLTIENLTEVPLLLTYVHIEGLNDWKLVGYNDYKKINAKELGVKVEGIELLRTINNVEKENIIIPAGRVIDLKVEMAVAPQERDITINFNIKVDVEIAVEYMESQREYVKSLLEIEKSMIKDLYKKEETFEIVEKTEGNERVIVQEETENLIVDESIIEVEEIREVEVEGEEVSLGGVENIIQEDLENEYLNKIVDEKIVEKINEIEENLDLEYLEESEEPERVEEIKEKDINKDEKIGT